MDASLPSRPCRRRVWYGQGETVISIAVLGIDLAEHVFQLHSVDAHGRAVVSRRVSRAKLAETVVQQPNR